MGYMEIDGVIQFNGVISQYSIFIMETQWDRMILIKNMTNNGGFNGDVFTGDDTGMLVYTGIVFDF